MTLTNNYDIAELESTMFKELLGVRAEDVCQRCGEVSVDPWTCSRCVTYSLCRRCHRELAIGIFLHFNGDEEHVFVRQSASVSTIAPWDLITKSRRRSSRSERRRSSRSLHSGTSSPTNASCSSHSASSVSRGQSPAEGAERAHGMTLSRAGSRESLRSVSSAELGKFGEDDKVAKARASLLSRDSAFSAGIGR